MKNLQYQLISIFHFYMLFVIGELYTTIKSHYMTLRQSLHSRVVRFYILMRSINTRIGQKK